MSYRPITDVWLLARPKVSYYGAYPNGFLERARPLLGIDFKADLLHVCSGRVLDYPNKRMIGSGDHTLDLDASLEPFFIQDARDPLPANPAWDALLADPPYTEPDADHYAPGRSALPTPSALIRNMLNVVKPGGKVGLLHYQIPRPPKTARFIACIGVVMGYGNAGRWFTVFERPLA